MENESLKVSLSDDAAEHLRLVLANEDMLQNPCVRIRYFAPVCGT